MSEDSDKKCAFVLAKAILRSAEAREASYDNKACEEVVNWTTEAKRKAAARGETLHISVDYDKFYRLSIMNACIKECPKDLVLPVWYLLSGSQRDSALDWANKTVAAGVQNG